MTNPASASAAPSSEEQSIVQRVVSGDRTAFELLMRRHNRRLYRLARAMLRCDADAEDALQEGRLTATVQTYALACESVAYPLRAPAILGSLPRGTHSRRVGNWRDAASLCCARTLATTFRRVGHDPRVARLLKGCVDLQESVMYNIVWLVGAVVIVLFVLGYVGLR